MKKLLLIIILLTQQVIAQDFSGQWHSILKVSGMQLRISIDLVKNDSVYSGKLISIDQGNSVLPMQWVKVNNNNLHFKTAVSDIEYDGNLNDSLISGTFVQGGQRLPLTFSRKVQEKTIAKRPQEPKPPFPYTAEDVSFFNSRDSIVLAGTLTLPSTSGKFPVVILITGSGPQNRNEELMGHKPFLVLADHLTRNGIAVLRYDDRGVAKSKGNFSTATSADFATDVDAAVAYLKTRQDIDPKKIGLIGHSEGGLIAPMVAARNSDVNYIVLMAGPGVPGKELLTLQVELQNKSLGMTGEEVTKQVDVIKGVLDIITMNGDSAVIGSAYRAYLSNSYKQLPDSVKKQVTEVQYGLQFARLNSSWMKFFLTYDPAPTLASIKIPVLALNGSKDLQVWAPQNLPAIEKALKKAGNKKYTVKEMPDLNHLFQECKTGAASEYSEIEQTLSPLYLNEVTTWIKKVNKQ